MYADLLQKIEESDMVLIGIGEEASVPFNFNGNEERNIDFWKDYEGKFNEELKGKIISFYNSFEKILSKKNYFFITTNIDGLIHESTINPIRIVAPCGNIRKLQCNCEGVEGIIDRMDSFFEDGEKKSCSKCKSMYEPNVFQKGRYNEEGYLKQWNLYNKWLQGTLNKKLLVLEIGCNFSMMSLIRLPFEKVVLINQKSEFYRINEKFPQVTAELSERMKSICQNPFEFIKDLEQTKNSL